MRIRRHSDVVSILSELAFYAIGVRKRLIVDRDPWGRELCQF
jgi:hypothetical protein